MREGTEAPVSYSARGMGRRGAYRIRPCHPFVRETVGERKHVFSVMYQSCVINTSLNTVAKPSARQKASFSAVLTVPCLFFDTSKCKIHYTLTANGSSEGIAKRYAKRTSLAI